MKRKTMIVFMALLVLTVSALAAETLVYEANFNKTDKKNVYWEPIVGEWDDDGEHLVNTDVNSGNTNIFQELDQVGDGTWIYEYKVTFDAKSNQWAPAAGLHFMCSDGEDPNRGDSYLVFQDYAEIQLYRAVGGGLNAVLRIPGFPAVVGQTSIVRIEYNTKIGLITINLNGEKVLEWTDDDPIVDGQFISFRTNGTQASYDYIKVWFKK